MSLEETVQNIVKHNVGNLCGWTVQAKAIWFGMGAVVGAAIGSLVTLITTRSKNG